MYVRQTSSKSINSWCYSST